MRDPLEARRVALDRLCDDPLDVLVVGGGATGAGIALDAADRGYHVGLVERDDLASGTSSKSSKLIHGGVRYLATGDVPMVVEGVSERNRLGRLAPHLVRPLGFVIPVDSRGEALLLRAGLTLYDAVGLGRSTRTHRRMSTDEVLRDAPGLVRGASRGGFRYDDAQTDDARLVLAIAQAAERRGALVLNHVEATGLDTGEAGHQVQLRDHVDGADLEVRARWVVHAAGVWADHLGGLGPEDLGAAISPAKGVHLVFDRDRLPVARAIVLPSVAGDGRRVFLIPWGQQTYLGTTDDLEASLAEGPTVSTSDAAYLLDAVNEAFGLSLGAADAIGAWAGWRPLVAAEGSTKDLSRRHVILEPRPGLLVITGGKLTTYRRMATDAVDRIVDGDGIRARSRTRRIELGATGPAAAGLAAVQQAVVAAGGDVAMAGSLYHRHGDSAVDLAAQFGPDGLARLESTLPYAVGEVAHAVRHEWAVTLEDLLARRLRVSLRHAAAGGGAILDLAAATMQEVLGWSDAHRDGQVASYLASVRAERGVVPLR